MAGNYSNYSSGKELVNLEEDIEETEAVIDHSTRIENTEWSMSLQQTFWSYFFWQTNAFVVKSWLAYIGKKLAKDIGSFIPFTLRSN